MGISISIDIILCFSILKGVCSNRSGLNPSHNYSKATKQLFLSGSHDMFLVIIYVSEDTKKEEK